MPITKSAKKEMKKSKRRFLINFMFKTNMKVAINVFLKKIAKGEKVDMKELSDVYKKIDKACKKNIIHKKNAARKKSRVARAFATVNK